MIVTPPGSPFVGFPKVRIVTPFLKIRSQGRLLEYVLQRARFDPIPPKTTVLVQMTDADGKSLLYEGEFAIGTNPLTIVSLP